MLKDLGFVAMDLVEFCGQWWLWVKMWWCCGGFVGFFFLIWVLLLRWWLWLAEVVVNDDDWLPSPPSSTPPSSCLRLIMRRGRTGWKLGRERERERDSVKGERKSNKEMRGEGKS